ncbi:MAG: hypothetical protein K2I36_02705 [Ureaplasma sp.]|nr:hypothetical protein [Ureaplasma sp.]
MEKQNQEMILKKDTKTNSLKSIKILLIIQIILFFTFVATLIWYLVAILTVSTTSSYPTSSYVNMIISITLFIISIIFYSVINLTLSIFIIVTGTKRENTKEIAIIFGILAIFFGWIFSLIYYLVAKNRIKK